MSVSSLAGIGHAYWVQLLGTLPFSLGDAANPSVSSQFPTITSGAAIAALAFSLIVLRSQCLSQTVSSEGIGRIPGSLTAQSICLMFIPPALTAITAKYQTELQPGMAYLQVYVQSLGFADAVGAGLLYVRNAHRQLRSLTWAILLISLVATFVLHSSRNLSVIDHRNAYWRTPRELTASAMSGFRESSGLTSILVDRPYLQRWENPDFAARTLGEPLPFTIRSTAAVAAAGADRLYINYTSAVGIGAPGFAHVGRVDSSVPAASNTPPRDNIIVVVRPAPHTPPLLLEYFTVPPNSKRELHAIPVPAASPKENRYVVLKELDPIEIGSVRVIVRP